MGRGCGGEGTRGSGRSELGRSTMQDEFGEDRGEDREEVWWWWIL
jgi:hypothetical protein